MTKAIDIWMNLFLPESMKKNWVEVMEDHLEMEGAAKLMNLSERTLAGYSVEEYVAIMDKVGIEMAFIPTFKMGSYYKKQVLIWDITVDDVRQVVDKRPDRFRGLYGINPLLKRAGVEELERAVKDHGFVGAHLHPYGFAPFNDRIWYPFFDKCEELGIPVLTQSGHSGERLPSAYGKPILMDDVALDFPNLKIIGCHTGWPWVEELLAIAWKHANVYIATSAHLPRYWDPSLVNFINTRGQDKVLWATDWPITTPDKNLAQVEEINLREVPKKKLLRENALKVFAI